MKVIPHLMTGGGSGGVVKGLVCYLGRLILFKTLAN
jgi:hypothetical protein